MNNKESIILDFDGVLLNVMPRVIEETGLEVDLSDWRCDRHLSKEDRSLFWKTYHKAEITLDSKPLDTVVDTLHAWKDEYVLSIMTERPSYQQSVVLSWLRIYDLGFIPVHFTKEKETDILFQMDQSIAAVIDDKPDMTRILNNPLSNYTLFVPDVEHTKGIKENESIGLMKYGVLSEVREYMERRNETIEASRA